jgi:hypothetical protein
VKPGGSERLHLQRGQVGLYPVLKVPRQGQLVLVVEIMHVNGINYLYDVGRAAL